MMDAMHSCQIWGKDAQINIEDHHHELEVDAGVIFAACQACKGLLSAQG